MGGLPFDMVSELIWGSTQVRKEGVCHPFLHPSVIAGITGTESLLNDSPVLFPIRPGIHLSDDGFPSHPMPGIS